MAQTAMRRRACSRLKCSCRWIPNRARIETEMKFHRPTLRVDGRRNENGLVATKRSEGASVLIIVLWIAIGLVSIALYFAHAMTFELRASDNRASGLASEQAIEGAARYLAAVLSNLATNGSVPDNTEFSCEAVPLGDARFWI